MPANIYTSRGHDRHAPLTSAELARLQAELAGGALSYLIGLTERAFDPTRYARVSEGQDGALPQR